MCSIDRIALLKNKKMCLIVLKSCFLNLFITYFKALPVFLVYIIFYRTSFISKMIFNFLFYVFWYIYEWYYTPWTYSLIEKLTNSSKLCAKVIWHHINNLWSKFCIVYFYDWCYVQKNFTGLWTVFECYLQKFLCTNSTLYFL